MPIFARYSKSFSVSFVATMLLYLALNENRSSLCGFTQEASSGFHHNHSITLGLLHFMLVGVFPTRIPNQRAKPKCYVQIHTLHKEIIK